MEHIIPIQLKLNTSVLKCNRIQYNSLKLPALHLPFFLFSSLVMIILDALNIFLYKLSKTFRVILVMLSPFIYQTVLLSGKKWIME